MSNQLFRLAGILLLPLLLAPPASAIPPTLVFQSGLGDGAHVWDKVVRLLGDRQATFRYDRPGYGRTPPASDARDPCTIAHELHEMLAARRLKPPYLLVGHSLGGLYQYVFARLYPEETAGLLLLDPTHPRHWETMKREAPAQAAIVGALGWTMGAAARREFADQAKCIDALPLDGALPPTRILVRTRYEPMETGGFRVMETGLQRDWLRLTAIQANRPVARSGHYIQRDRPDVVVAAIDELSGE